MKLFCFDVDGTLLTEEMEKEIGYVRGKIPTEKLIDLEKKGNKIAIVSPSPYLPERYANDDHWFKDFGSNEYRWANILKACNFNEISFENTIYVDDLEANRNQMEEIGIKSYSPYEFLDTNFNNN